MNRRKFLRIGSLGIGIALSGFGLWRFSLSREDILVNLIREELGGIVPEETGLSQYARDLLADRKWTWWQLQGFDLSRPWKPEMAYIRDYVVRRYALSSDYFSQDPPPQTMQYQGLYDPYQYPCANPFYNSPSNQ